MSETIDATPEVKSASSTSEPGGQKLPSLWRNRAFNLLWGSQALSRLGSSMSGLALPLLTLGITGSPIQAGVVGTAGALVRLACQLPAGVVTDRFERRRLMLWADAIRLIAYGLLAYAVITDRVTLVWIIVTTMVASLFDVAHQNAQFGAIRNVVPLAQLPEATARNEARGAAVSLVGPPIGGALYSAARSLPFLADAISYLLSFIGVWLIRKPMQQERTEPHGHPVKELVEGVKFTLGEPFLRAVLFIAAPMNLAFNGLSFSIIVILQQQGTPPALIGTVETIIGIGALTGAVMAPMLTRRIPLRLLAMGIAWFGVAMIALSAALTGSILVGVPMAVAIFFGPACNAALFGYQAAITPDRLQGRVISVIFLAAMSLASVSALLGGLLVHTWGGPAAILVFAAVMSISAVSATMSKGMRKMRPLSELTATNG